MARTARSISLTELEKEELFAITTKGTPKSRKIIRARVLLLLDEGKSRLTIQEQVRIDSNHF